MRIIEGVRLQLSQIRYAMLLTGAGVLIGLVPVILLISLRHVEPELLTRDIFASTDSPIYTGFLSNLGLFVWSAAAAIWLLAALLLARVDLRHPLLPFAIGSGLFSTLMLFDDAFMFHELLLPDYLGIPEKAVMLAYILIAMSYVGLNIRHILRSPYILLGMAVGFLGLSMALDEFVRISELETLIEDSLKFAGIVFWCGYAATAAIQIVEGMIDKPDTPAGARANSD
ncbi:hypothetical protein K2Z83_17300 [Oscillochloris sp. ZM17-4]|uniref:hypothetical protein n=1 Tax=Oscillochloris sp. ZM17-4 TaxID=2866714 RepID=UPI001C733D5F|nr:hypothetical protein [Oscillochloris sp. ZM17-4]MBX0329430.1 hypothetical protein [Oscillochloris sp. ZM17-4]